MQQQSLFTLQMVSGVKKGLSAYMMWMASPTHFNQEDGGGKFLQNCYMVEEYRINSDMSIDLQKHSGLKAFLRLINEDYVQKIT